MRRLSLLSVLMLLLFPLGSLGQTGKGSIIGHVTDASHAVIQSARVVVVPGNFTTSSDDLGDFVINALTPGSYKVTVTSVGFSKSVQTVTVIAGQSITIDPLLQVSSSSEQVVVSAESGQDMIQAVNEEMTSPNIVEVMPRTDIVALPNSNMADAIGRMAGVTLQRNEGEGEYIQVRGLDPRLTNLTIDGVTIPSPEAAVRQINLSTIPSDMVQSIELNRTLSANQDADGIGGSVNLVTKTAGERPTFDLGSTMGYTPIENGRYMGKLDTTIGQRFGASKRLGLIMGGDYDYNGRGINDVEPTPDLDASNITGTAPYYDSATLREYRFQRLRWGATVGADYKLNDHSTISAHGLFSDFKDWGDKWYYEIQSNDKPKFYQSRRRPDFAIGSLTVGGNHAFNSSWFTWGSAVSRSRELNSGGNPKITYNPVSALKKWASNNCNYVGGSKVYLPQWSAACMTPNSNAADNIYSLSNYTMNQFVTTTGQSVQLNLQEWASGAKNYHVGSHTATLEVGGEFRNNHKFQNAYTPTYDAASGINAAQFQSAFTDPQYYGGGYNMGQVTDYYKESTYFGANQGNFTLNQTDTHTGSDSNNFDLIERVSAGYIMNTINWDHFRLQTGLRIEGTGLSTLGYLVSTVAGPNGDSLDNNNNWIGTTSTTSSQTYWDPLPSIQARWQANPLTAIRAVYARGISRPNPYDLIPYVLETDGGSSQFSIGNPKEQPTHANNFDLLVEQELKPFGLIEAGFFFKQLSDPIVAANLPYQGQIANQPINGSNANVAGIEVSWQQKFTNLPGGLRGTGITANYAYTASNTNGLPGRTDSPSLMGTAKNSFNINPSYEYKRYSAHMGTSYNGSNIDAYQYSTTTAFCSNTNPNPTTAAPLNGPINGPCGDNYFYPHLQIDAQAGMRLYKGLHFEVEGLNLTNEVFGFYNGSPQYMTQREYYKPTYSASLRWTSGSEK